MSRWNTNFNLKTGIFTQSVVKGAPLAIRFLHSSSSPSLAASKSFFPSSRGVGTPDLAGASAFTDETPDADGLNWMVKRASDWKQDFDANWALQIQG
jgi:hypothetical protein